jgi:hypothetical protein
MSPCEVVVQLVPIKRYLKKLDDFFIKFSNTKDHENPFSVSSLVPCFRTAGLSDSLPMRPIDTLPCLEWDLDRLQLVC